MNITGITEAAAKKTKKTVKLQQARALAIAFVLAILCVAGASILVVLAVVALFNSQIGAGAFLLFGVGLSLYGAYRSFLWSATL
jgi:hypothetical protein